MNVVKERNRRLVPLEAYRGIAAFIVLIHHFFLGFLPFFTGYLENRRRPDSLIGQPFFVFFNGSGAVWFFFTLSGFVLSWSYFHHKDAEALKLASIKRYPRLVLTVTVIVLCSYALFKFNGYAFYQAAQYSNSPWLAGFAYGGWKPGFQPDFFKALMQGLFTFFTGDASYNTNLWTMKPELRGSMLVFLLAWVFVRIHSTGKRQLLFAVLLWFSVAHKQQLFPFIAGSILSFSIVRYYREIPLGAALLLIVTGGYLLGFVIPARAYSWATFIPEREARPLLNTIGSVCIIGGTMLNPKIFTALSGNFYRFLGRISFPLYLVHILVLCSLSSALYCHLIQQGIPLFYTLTAVFFLTVVISTGAALLLSRMDEWWVYLVNRFVAQHFGKKPHTEQRLAS